MLLEITDTSKKMYETEEKAMNEKKMCSGRLGPMNNWQTLGNYLYKYMRSFRCMYVNVCACGFLWNIWCVVAPSMVHSDETKLCVEFDS